MTEVGKQTLKYSAISVLASMVGASIPVLILAFRLGVWSDKTEVIEKRQDKSDVTIEQIHNQVNNHEVRISAVEQWRSWEKDLRGIPYSNSR